MYNMSLFKNYVLPFHYALLIGTLPAPALAQQYLEKDSKPLAREEIQRIIEDSPSIINPKSNSPISHSFTIDFVETTNKMLIKQEQVQLSNQEILELGKIAQSWATPIKGSVYLYLCVFGLIIGHSIIKKNYKWSFPMLLIGTFLPALVWIAPLSYTRRYLFTESLSQQLPMTLLQILPTFVWWSALIDLAQWYERVIRIRGL